MTPLRFPQFLAILGFTLSLALSSCLAPGNWLVGKWEFDKQATEAAAKTAAGGDAAAAKGFLESLSTKVGGAVSSAVAGQLEGTKLEITATELRRVGKDGSGSAVGYKIIERPNANTLVIQDTKGEIMTWNREGQLIWRTMDKEGKLRIYLKRA